MSTKVATTEPLYDVTNSAGVRLLADVGLDAAHLIHDERLAEPDKHPEWQGEITFRLLRGAYLEKRAPTKRRPPEPAPPPSGAWPAWLTSLAPCWPVSKSGNRHPSRKH